MEEGKARRKRYIAAADSGHFYADEDVIGVLDFRHWSVLDDNVFGLAQHEGGVLSESASVKYFNRVREGVDTFSTAIMKRGIVKGG